MDVKFDIKAKIDEIVAKLQKDENLRSNFQKEPIQVVEKLLGVSLPDEKLQPLISGVKAKLAAGDLGDKLGGLKKLF